MRKSLLHLLLLLCASSSFAQLKPNAEHAKNTAINWQIIENSHAGGSQFLSAIVLQNLGNSFLGHPGWKLYFNFARTIKPETVTGNLEIVHVNGDLFYIQPAAGYKPVKKGGTLKTTFVSSDWAVNRTDSPEGFYVVFDQEPGKPYPVNNVKAIPSTRQAQFARTAQDHVPPITPELIYNQNKSITDIPVKDLQKIFPTPQQYQAVAGTFNLDKNVSLKSDAEFQVENDYLKEKLDHFLQPATSNSKSGSSIQLRADKSIADEAYRLEISSNGISITASGRAGIFYGIQSLLSTFPVLKNGTKLTTISLQNATVNDQPRFPFRGLMVDVGRNFQTKEEIIKILDLMAMYKLNVLHFHLNDDEGWRLEIQGLPELTAVGAKRGHLQNPENNPPHLPPSFGSGPANTDNFGTGYYSTQDFIQILKHANARHIRVIPEIEAPGHARAAIRSMESRYHQLMKAGKEEEAKRYLLNDLNDRSVYRSVQNWNDNVMDVSLPSTYNFIEKISDEIISMYKAAGAPLQTIHFGGDEVPLGAWEGSPNSLEFIKKHPELKDVNGLWTYFYGNIERILKSKNLYLSGWEEVGMKPVLTDGKRAYVINPEMADKNIHLNVWNNIIGWGAEDLAYKLANTGYKVILSGVSNLYFDMAYQKSFEEPGYYWGEYVDIDKAFNFIPYNSFLNSNKDKFGNTLTADFYNSKERLTEKGKANIVGMQGLLWSETIKGAADIEYMIMPKLLGLAERAWAADPAWANETDAAKRDVLYQQAWSQFANTVGKKELPRIDASFSKLNYRLPPAGATVIDGKVHLNIQLPGLTIRYTTDNSEPTLKSAVYTEPIPTKGLIRFRTFDSKGRAGKLSEIKNGPAKDNSRIKNTSKRY